MADEQLVDEYPDRVTAREFLDQADEFMADATRKDLGSASRSVLFHNAAICACDAVLQAAGKRVVGGDNAHVRRIRAALDRLPGDTADLFDRLDASRERRNEASYRAGFVPQASLDDAAEATAELIALARAFVGER